MMPQNKESRRKRAAELKAASDQLTVQQKLDIAYGRRKAGKGECRKEIKRLEKELAKVKEPLKQEPVFASKAEQRRVEKAKGQK
jgi:hypothetical protein